MAGKEGAASDGRRVRRAMRVGRLAARHTRLVRARRRRSRTDALARACVDVPTARCTGRARSLPSRPALALATICPIDRGSTTQRRRRSSASRSTSPWPGRRCASSSPGRSTAGPRPADGRDRRQVARHRPAHRLLHRHGAGAPVARAARRRSAPRCTSAGWSPASMIRELGPVLAGLMVAGRVGSGIAAQLGSMRVTEQIDALNTLGTDPIKKLVTPRVLAALIMLPVLTIINDFVGIIGGNIIATLLRRRCRRALYWRTVWEQIASGGFTFRYHPERLHPGARQAVRLRRDHLDHGVLLRPRTRPAAPRASGSRTTRTVVLVEHPDPRSSTTSSRRSCSRCSRHDATTRATTAAPRRRGTRAGGRRPTRRARARERPPTRRTGARRERRRDGDPRAPSASELADEPTRRGRAETRPQASADADAVIELEHVSPRLRRADPRGRVVRRARRARRSSSSASRARKVARSLKLILRLLVPDKGRVLHRRRGHHRPHLRGGARGAPEDGDGVPGRGAVRLDDRVRERRVSAARAHGPHRGRDRGARAREAGVRGPRSGQGAWTSCRRSCRAACGSASASRAGWPTTRRSCSTTSRRRGSTRSPPARSRG